MSKRTKRVPRRAGRDNDARFDRLEASVHRFLAIAPSVSSLVGSVWRNGTSPLGRGSTSSPTSRRSSGARITPTSRRTLRSSEPGGEDARGLAIVAARGWALSHRFSLVRQERDLRVTAGSMKKESEKSGGVYRAVRLSADLDRALHDIAARMSSPYQKATLSTAIRATLVEGVAVLDAKLPPIAARRFAR